MITTSPTKSTQPSPTPFSCLYADLANCIRFLSADAVEKAKSGHPGMPMGMADVAAVLWKDFLTFDPAKPDWPNRDRFVLSAGHGSMLLYSLLYLTGYEDMTLDQLKSFRQWGSKTAGHPEYGYAAGIETTTGPLGQGVANAVGMALGQKILAAQFGEDLINYKIYAIASDGDLMEGISQEAISLAGHLCLNNLIILYDDNHISIDGPTSLSFSDETQQRFKASHWDVCTIDGHKPEEIYEALSQARSNQRPTLICCKTTIAKGAPTKAGSAASHGSPLGSAEIQAMRDGLGWSYPPFEIPQSFLKDWREIGKTHHQTRLDWEKKLLNHPKGSELARYFKKELPPSLSDVFDKYIQGLVQTPVPKATRQLSQMVLDEIASHIPEMIGGSADLTGSNNTKAKSQEVISPTYFEGHYIHYGVREHGMAGIMNGLCLSGLRPYGGTFLIFSDYLRPSLRLAALMELPVIYVLTHDSIGLGEDGPTHQPIEHLAALRAIPNLNVFRPADGVEVAECWKLALESKTHPSVIVLTRQNIKPVRLELTSDNLSQRGGYVIRKSSKRDVSLIATGSEVGLAVDVADSLEKIGVHAAVISIPCTRLFDEQPKEYRDSVLGNSQTLRVVIEAASPFGWDHYVGQDGIKCCIDTFGASAPGEIVYEHYGLTVDSITQRVLKGLEA